MNCAELVAKAAGGKLTEKEVLEAIEQEQKIREAFIQSGKTDNLDARVARRIAQLAMDKKIEAARLKRQIAQNIRARTKIDSKLNEFTKAGLSPTKAIRALWEGSQRSIEGARENGYAQGLAYEARWTGSAMGKIQRERPHILKLFTNKKFDDAVTREMWELREGGTPGKTGNSDAAYLAKVLASTMEMARTDQNGLGAAIGKLDGYAGPQVHDDMEMAKTSAAQWTDEILPWFDVDRSFPDAADEAEVRDILGGVFDTIITGVSNDVTPLLTGQRVGPANLATRLGKHRVLHFKDADAAIKYRDKYGRGSTIQGIFATLSRQAKTAGAMDMFGPNPKAMLLAVAARQQKNLKAKIDGMAPGKAKDRLVKQMKDLTAADGEIAKLKSTIDDITGMAQRPVDIRWATIGENIRGAQSMAKLGGAVITAMPSDTATMASAAMFRGQGFWNGIHKTMGEFANRKNGKEVGMLLGEGFDAITGHLASAYADGAPGTLTRWQQTFFKVSGLSGWTDTARSVSARVIAAHLGNNVGKSFNSLDASLAHVLKLNGITELKWDALRSAGVKEVNGRMYLMPDAARLVDEAKIEAIVRDEIEAARAVIIKPTKAGNITDAMQAKFDAKREKIIARARKNLELDLYRYYADETSYAVIETDAASRRFATGGYRPGTPAGEAIRYIMQFKGFPIAFSQRVLGRTILNAPKGRGQQAMHIGATLAGLTVAGYMAMTAKDMARGLGPPRDPTDPATIIAAMTQGGALGIYGDFLYGTRTRFGSDFITTASGPSIGTLSDVWKIWQDLREGNPKAGSYLDLALQNTPFINLFYTRAALDILFINSLRDAVKPGSLKKQEKFIKKERGQEFFLPRTAF